MTDDGLAPDDDLLPEDPAEMLLGAVNFGALSPTDFEEFCFDLMSETGFVNVDWRKGTPKGVLARRPRPRHRRSARTPRRRRAPVPRDVVRRLQALHTRRAARSASRDHRLGYRRAA